jgi:hypothetical protein
VHDFPLSDLRLMDAANFGDRGTLIVGEWLLLGPGFGILLSQPLHDEVKRALGGVAHEVTPCFDFASRGNLSSIIAAL